MRTMDTAKSIECLTWSDAIYSLNEFLEKFGVPNLVCIKEGHYGINEACTFENDQVLMLHALRRKRNVLGEDAIGRPIAIPLQCENKLLRCPLSIYCNYDTINVSQMSCVYPDIKYFRVLENHWDEGLYYLEPESILEIENINSRNSAVKFKDIDQPLPLDCSVVFEPLLDYCEYTLKSVVSLSGLPAMVRFLRTPKSNQEVDNEFENLVSNLGKVTLIHSAEPQTVVVATKMDADSLRSAKTSVRCSQIPKDNSVNVSVATGLLKNDPAYLNIVRELNQTFLDKYDLNELDNLEKCQYLDRPNGNTRGVLGSVLVAKVHEQNNNVPELLPRTRRDVKFPPPIPPKPLKGTKQTRKQETVGQYETRKDTNKKEETLGHYDDVKPRRHAYHEDVHVYESISDSSSDDGYEEIDDNGYEDIANRMKSRDHVTMTRHDYVDMSSKVHATSQSCVNVTSDYQESKTSEEDEYYTMCDSVLKNKRNDNENSTLMLERTSKNLTGTARLEPARKILLKIPFAEGLCGLRSKPDGKSTTEIMMLEPNSKNSDEAIGLKSDHKTSQNVPIPTDLPTLIMKPDSNNSSENVKLEPAREKPIPTTRTRSTVLTCKPTLPIPNDKCVLPDRKTRFVIPIPTDLSSLTVEGVGRLLASLNMACYAEKFEKEQVDGEILMELDETALKSLDLMPFHVRKLMKVIAGWRPNVDSDKL